MKSLLLVGATLLSLVGAVVTFAVGVVDGHLLDLREWSTICTAKPLNPVNPYGSSSWFPPSQSCRWSDGTTTDLVPPYVSPLLFALLALTAVLLVLTVRSVRRQLAAA